MLPNRAMHNIYQKFTKGVYLNIFLKFQCGFREGLSAQYCLMSMTEKWKKSEDKGNTFPTLLTDLSKAFDCLPHDLIIAKLDACGFIFSPDRLLQSYL